MAEPGILTGRQDYEPLIRALLIAIGAGIWIWQSQLESEPVKMQMPPRSTSEFCLLRMRMCHIFVPSADVMVRCFVVLMNVSRGMYDTRMVVVHAPITRQFVIVSNCRRRNRRCRQQRCQQQTHQAAEEAGEHKLLRVA